MLQKSYYFKCLISLNSMNMQNLSFLGVLLGHLIVQQDYNTLSLILFRRYVRAFDCTAGLQRFESYPF